MLNCGAVLAILNLHVHFTTRLVLCCSFPFYSTLPGERWSAPSLRPNSSDLTSAMTSFPLQRGILDRIQTSPSLPAKRMHTAATMQSSPAFLKTTQLFEDDRKFATRQLHASSCQAIPVQGQKHSQDRNIVARQKQLRISRSPASSLVRTQSDSSGNSVADSVSSYHGYYGVNYQSSK